MTRGSRTAHPSGSAKPRAARSARPRPAWAISCATALRSPRPTPATRWWHGHILPGGNLESTSKAMIRRAASAHEHAASPDCIPEPNTQGAPTVVPPFRRWAMIVWQDRHSDPNGDIFARKFLADGTAAGDTIRVLDPGPYGGAPQDSPGQPPHPAKARSWSRGSMTVPEMETYMRSGSVPTGRRIGRNISREWWRGVGTVPSSIPPSPRRQVDT